MHNANVTVSCGKETNHCILPTIHGACLEATSKEHYHCLLHSQIVYAFCPCNDWLHAKPSQLNHTLFQFRVRYHTKLSSHHSPNPMYGLPRKMKYRGTYISRIHMPVHSEMGRTYLGSEDGSAFTAHLNSCRDNDVFPSSPSSTPQACK